jgi:two-component system, NarL family, sensor histidine kinase UhpB
MKKFLRFCSVLFLCGVLFNSAQAQNQQMIDSLLNVLKTVKEDTGKVKCIYLLGQEMIDYNPDTSIILSNQALTLAKKINWKKGISTSLGNLGSCYFNKGDYTQALDYFLNALKMAEEIGNKNGIEVFLGNIGMAYSTQGDYLKALEYYFKALRMAEESGNKIGIARHFSNIGVVYDDQGDYPKALAYYFKALKMAEELGDKQLQANNIGNIGIVYSYQRDYTNALNYFFKDLKLRKELGDKVGEAEALINTGITYGSQGDKTKELDYYLQALKMMEELGDKNGIAASLGNIGSVYMSTGNFKEAEANLKRAIAIDDSIGNQNDLRQFEESLSKLYDTTAQVAMRNGQWQMAAEKYKLSMMHYKKTIALKDTLFNQEKNDEITRKEMNYEFDKKEVATNAAHDKQLAVADVEIKKQKLIKNFFIGGLALLLILSFFVYNNFRTANKLKLQNIRNRIASDLHDDVGSTLNSISVYSEVAKQKSPAVVDELEQIGDASRKIIEVMSDIVWTINPKNDTFENIISRMGTLAYNLLKAKNIEHTFQADESLNETKLSLESRRNFYLIFKEALNNLVKYSNATRASISLTSENGMIKLSVRDNGTGFNVAQTSKGNGLLNMKARAEEMKAQLKIESEKGSGTNVELILKG